MNPLARGVRIARVITISSACFAVLCQTLACVYDVEGNANIADNPDEPGVKCLRMELSLSAIVMLCEKRICVESQTGERILLKSCLEVSGRSGGPQEVSVGRMPRSVLTERRLNIPSSRE